MAQSLAERWLHFGFEVAIDQSSAIAGLGSATILLYLAFSLGVQREVVRRRAQTIAHTSSQETVRG